MIHACNRVQRRLLENLAYHLAQNQNQQSLKKQMINLGDKYIKIRLPFMTIKGGKQINSAYNCEQDNPKENSHKQTILE